MNLGVKELRLTRLLRVRFVCVGACSSCRFICVLSFDWPSPPICTRASRRCYSLQNEFREYPTALRQAVSVGRRLQDPLAEFAGLCVEEDELLCLKFHPLQVGP